MGTQKNKTLFKSIFESEYIPLEGLANGNQEHWNKHQRISKESLTTGLILTAELLFRKY